MDTLEEHRKELQAFFENIRSDLEHYRKACWGKLSTSERGDWLPNLIRKCRWLCEQPYALAPGELRYFLQRVQKRLGQRPDLMKSVASFADDPRWLLGRQEFEMREYRDMVRQGGAWWQEKELLEDTERRVTQFPDEEEHLDVDEQLEMELRREIEFGRPEPPEE